MRIVQSIAIATSVVLLAGCAGMFAPDPTGAPHTQASTPRQVVGVTCRPATSRFAWNDPTPVEAYEAVSVATQSYDGSQSGTAFDVPNPDFAFSGDENSTAMLQVIADIGRWTPVIAKSLRTSVSVPTNLGEVSSIVNATQFTPPKPHKGTWVRAVVARTDSYRLALTCQDGTTADGMLFGGADPATATTILVHCDSKKHRKDSPRKAVARAECTFANVSAG